MRKASICLAVLGLALLAVPSMASAVPTVKFKAQAVPIPGFPGTGNIAGAGAAVQAEYTIEGNEYAGGPPPIIGVNFFLPKGTKLHTSGFPTCASTTLEQFGPVKCPKGSSAGPLGRVVGFVTFGSERVEEALELSSFYSPGGGVEFFTKGSTPVSLEILSKGHYTALGGAGGFGPELLTEVPLVASVPGAPYASVKTINVKAGSAYKKGKETVYYGRLPSGKCSGGLKVKTEVIFAENGETSKPLAVPASYTAPCPRRAAK
jgi:hypothetical protein